MNNYERLEGMVAATFTPMDENGDVNLSVIEKYADWIASTPIKGVFVCGTTGEFSSLTIDERKLILEKWVASAGKRFKVIAHVGSNCQRSAMELACHAEKAGLCKMIFRFCFTVTMLFPGIEVSSTKPSSPLPPPSSSLSLPQATNDIAIEKISPQLIFLKLHIF